MADIGDHHLLTPTFLFFSIVCLSSTG